MSNENNNAINMAATENENIAINEMEMMDNLKAERDALLERIEILETKLKNEKDDRSRIYGWYTKEQDKVRALAIIINAMKCDYVSIEKIVDNITEMV